MYRQSEENLLSSNTSSTCPYNMVYFGPLAAEIVSLVWGTAGNLNGFRILSLLLHDTVVVGVSQTLQHWTEGATCIRQGGHHVGHWPTFLFSFVFMPHCSTLYVYVAYWYSNVVCLLGSWALRNGWTDQNVVCDMDLDGLREPYIRWGVQFPHVKGQFWGGRSDLL